MSHEIGFSDRFALSENRDAVLKELIPGMETYFYYHSLHCQTVGKLAESRGYLNDRLAKFGLTEQATKIQPRQFLLEYQSNTQATFDHWITLSSNRNPEMFTTAAPLLVSSNQSALQVMIGTSG